MDRSGRDASKAHCTGADALFSGLLEVLLAKEVGDRTAWQTMLKGNGADQDLEHIRQQLMSSCAQGIAGLQLQHGEAAFELLEDAPETRISYPVLSWPEKVKGT